MTVVVVATIVAVAVVVVLAVFERYSRSSRVVVAFRAILVIIVKIIGDKSRVTGTVFSHRCPGCQVLAVPREAPSCWPCSSRGPAIQLLAPQKALVVTFRLGRAEGARKREDEQDRRKIERDEATPREIESGESIEIEREQHRTELNRCACVVCACACVLARSRVSLRIAPGSERDTAE